MVTTTTATTTTKTTAVAGEIDAWCTKCKLDLNHRVVAMVGEKAKRVLCLTCKGEHNYVRPKSAPKKAPAVRATRARSTTRPTRTTAAEREAAAAKAERLRILTWEKAIAGQPTSAFRTFRITDSFAEGDLVRHTKFGDGVVSRVVDRLKVEILFQDGSRTMAHGQPS